MKDWLRRHPVAAIVAFGFLLRLALLFHWKDSVAGIQDDYYDRAVMMLRHQPMSMAMDLFRPPLYAWALYALFLIVGVNTTVASILQCLLGAATGWMLYRIARALGDEKAGIAAAAVWAVNIYSVFYSARLMNETLYVALTVAFFWVWIERPKLYAPVAGLLAALSCLCKWTFMGFLPWFAVAEAWPVLKRRSDWKPLALCLATAALVIGLWGLRNESRYGRFILAGPQKGWNFYEGLALQLSEDPERPRQMAEEAKQLGLDKDPFAQDDYFWKKGWSEVKADPGAAFWLFTGKTIKFWRLAPYPPHPRLVRWAAGIFYLLLFACALQGGILLHRRGIVLAPVYALFLYTWLLHTVFFSGIRYRFPLDPFLSLLAGFSLSYLVWGEERTAGH